MRVQKIWKYRYQVASKQSAEYHAVDFIYSAEHLRDGHYYEVQVNDNMKFPQIVNVIREVSRAIAPT
jgi:hypothetical protein